MKIEGYVICMPINTWGDKTKSPWHPFSHTFGATAKEAWIRYLNLSPFESDDWDTKQTHFINCGYCVKEATLEVTW